MTRSTNEEIVGLDIGTSKVSCVIAEVNDENEIAVIGVGTAPSTGLFKGTIVDMEKTKRAIQEAVREAEQMAGSEVGHVYVGIAGKNIALQRAEGVVALNTNPKDLTLQTVTEESISRVKRAAMTSLQLLAGQEPIHEIPLKYTLDDDDQDSIQNPLGLSGTKLKATINVITASANAVQNIRNCVKSAGLETDAIVLEPLASAESCLSDSERQTGVCLIDIGHGTTDISVYHHGVMVHSAVIPLGGSNLTKDLAILARLPEDVAERIKVKYGTLKTVEGLTDDDKIDTSSESSAKTEPIGRLFLYDILYARVSEILQTAFREIQKSGKVMDMVCGAVLTGGAAKMEGLDALAEEILGMRVRIGKPKGIVGMQELVDNPAMSTCVGLVLYQYNELHRSEMESDGDSASGGFFHNIGEILRQFFC